ncbi:MAG: redox-regulated ATPase YchF [Candidatus Saccharimonadales bacterium]
MSLKIGIVGLPNVGKSTLFNALTNDNILAANYPFATIEPNTGIVPVPDARLNVLRDLYNAQKILPATITFVDIAGLVAGASKGEGLGNKFLANIRQCDAIVHIVRAFNSDTVLRHDESAVNPRADIEIINTELMLADIQTIESRLPRIQKESKSNPTAREQVSYLETLLRHLKSGTLLSTLPSINIEHATDLHLLTAKPIIYAFNVDENGLTDTIYQQELNKLVAPARSLFVCAKIEDELKGLDASDIKEILKSYGVTETGIEQMIHAAYDILGLQSYLTAGEKEIRAWTIHQGNTAPQAAGVIHTDFERGFIAAQIVDYDELIKFGSEAAAKAAGKMRTEGKDYVMRPGDIVDFRFNV